MLHTGDSEDEDEDEDSPLEGCLVCVNCAVRSAKVDASRVCRAATAEWVLAEVTSLRFIGHLMALPSLTPSPSDTRAIWTLRAMSNETRLSWLQALVQRGCLASAQCRAPVFTTSECQARHERPCPVPRHTALGLRSSNRGRHRIRPGRASHGPEAGTARDGHCAAPLL